MTTEGNLQHCQIFENKALTQDLYCACNISYKLSTYRPVRYKLNPSLFIVCSGHLLSILVFITETYSDPIVYLSIAI